MFQLRPYQEALLRDVRDGLAAESNGRLMLQLPTGGGKTVIAGALLADWLRDGRKAVWLTHRKELAEQTQRMLTDAGVSAITNVNWTPGEDAPAWAGGAVILMAQTVGRRITRREARQVWNRYSSDDLLVIDEAHHTGDDPERNATNGWVRAMHQWPGPVVGMTATPWRLLEKERFDHLFGQLICGPQTAELQALDTPALCQAQVLIPPPDQQISGGNEFDPEGDYAIRGIERANRDRPDIMTAGALAFWRQYAEGRPTIAYAVSVDHAHNLADVFKAAGMPAAVILGDTNREERDKAIAGFRDGSIRVLVNVIVATEGFDLPDASCIIIARPTMSLALYLQMVGRGLRPKPDGGYCIILDLAANAVTHGLPEDYRDWSLEPRGTKRAGEAPVVICPLCETASHSASHNCRACSYSFGKDCERCGRWRAHKRWIYETECGDAHQMVCDLCHIDAHIQAHLPVAPPLDALVELYEPEDEMTFPSDIEIDDDLANRLSALFRELLESERRSIAGADDARREELRQLIEWRELVLADDEELDVMFEGYIVSLPEAERPATRVQKRRMFGEWEGNLQSELAGWQDELAQLESRAVDKQAIYDSARDKALRMLMRVAGSVELLPDYPGGNGVLSTAPSGQQSATDISLPSTSLTPTTGTALPVTLVPSSETAFKDALMRTKQAWIVTTYQDGREEVSPWRANNITPSSNIVGNIRSRPQFRSGAWQGNGIASVKVSIDGPNVLPETPLSGTEPKRFYIRSNRNGASAECDVYNEKRIVVLAGSTATKKDVLKWYPNYQRQKERLITEGVLIDVGHVYRFVKDHAFTSPSAVGQIVMASPTNGRRNLKDANGVPFAEYFPK